MPARLFVSAVFFAALCVCAASKTHGSEAPTAPEEQAGTSRPAGADKVDAIAQQFKGTHDIAGAAEALNNAVGSTMTYQDEGNTGMAQVTTVTELLDQRSMICYEFVHWAAYVAGDQRTIRGASPRLGPSAPAAHQMVKAVAWDGTSDIPRNKMVTFVAHRDNNSSGYFHIGISLGGGRFIHFPSVGGIQVSDLSKYNDPGVFKEVLISDYSWMSAQGDSYQPSAAPTLTAPATTGTAPPPSSSGQQTIRGGRVLSAAPYAVLADNGAWNVNVAPFGTSGLGRSSLVSSFKLRSALESAAPFQDNMTVTFDFMQKAQVLPGVQGEAIVHYAGSYGSTPPPQLWQERLGSIRFVAFNQGRAQDAPTRPNVRVYFTSTGRSSGPAMTMTVVNLSAAPVNIVGRAFALEPVRITEQELRRELQRYPAARVTTTTLDGYCMDIGKAPPTQGMVFRLADADRQTQMGSLADIGIAARRLTARGALRPDLDPIAYGHALLQWSVWAHRERFDEAAYTRAFLEHGKKNIEGAGRKWTREIESGLRGLTPNRWRDIKQVLALAAEIGR